MKIIKTPTISQDLIKIKVDDRSLVNKIVSDVVDRFDRILGGDPEPYERYHTIHIPGATRISEGTITPEAGETIVLGKKFDGFVVDDFGRKLYGILPIQDNLDGTYEFYVDYITH